MGIRDVFEEARRKGNELQQMQVCRAKNAERKARESKHGQKGLAQLEGLDQRCVDSSVSTVASDSESDKPSRDVQSIRDVFEEARRKGNELQQMQARATKPTGPSPPEHGKRRPAHAQSKARSRGLAK